MRANGIRSKRVTKFRITTTDSRHGLPVAENVFGVEQMAAMLAETRGEEAAPDGDR